MTEKEKLAYGVGYDAAWDLRLNLSDRVTNPYDVRTREDEHYAWERGFEDGRRKDY